jgi:hypothetical protein
MASFEMCEALGEVSSTMNNIASFAADYSEAREKFLAAARLTDAQTFRYDNPTKGPKGEALSTDVAWVGPADASKVMVTISSTHGVEGYCGSGFQVDWLAGRRRLGTAQGHRGVVRARDQPLRLRLDTPRDGGGQRPQPQLCRSLEALSGERGVSRDRRRSRSGRFQRGGGGRRPTPVWRPFRRKVGDVEFFRAVSSGQYSHADGMFFGGGGPSWSNRTLHAIVDRYLKGREDVAVVDFHTGLGPYGYGEPITHYDIGTGGSRRVRNFWGESVTESKRGQTASQARDGLGHYGLNRVLKEPQTRLTMCTLEYGTFDRESGQKAFRADHWLHKYGDPLGKEAEPVRKAMRRQFYPETDDWKEAVLFRGHQVVRQAIAGLQRGPL